MPKSKRDEYPQEAMNRNLRELDLPEQSATAEALLKQIPLIGLMRGLGQQSQINERVQDPEFLHNTAGRGLETNYQRGAPFDEAGKKDVPMMSEGGVAGVDGMVSNPEAEPMERSTETAGVEIPEDIREYVDKAHKTMRESRPDEGWRVTRAGYEEPIAPYKQDEEADQGEGEKTSGIPNFDEGGMVSPQDEGPGPNDPASDGIQPVDPKDIPAPVAPMTPDVSRETIPAPSGAAPAPTDQDFMNRANKTLGLDPTQTAGFMKMLGDRSQKAQLGAGLAGIGDAIASGGTLGKVNPGALRTSEDLIQNRETAGLQGMQTIRENQGKALEVADKLEARDPKSPLSKWAQKAYGDVGRKIGIDLSNASAALIGDVTGKGVEALNTQYQNQLKMMGLDLQKKQVEATIGNQRAERDIAREGHQAEAAKTLADRGILKTLANAIPGTAGHNATKILEKQAAGYEPDVTAYAQKHGITTEQAQAIKDKRNGGK